ncbi:MAG: hypothetical protein NZ899_12030 [Thermoguttaceae bacterium]|nr:hypothetical protein [Thermoguttaceae bacterium]
MKPVYDKTAFAATLASCPFLAAWWLFACTIYFPPNWWGGLLSFAAGLGLLTIGQVRLLKRGHREAELPVSSQLGSTSRKPLSLVAGALFVLAAVVFPWPYRLAPLLLAVGLWAQSFPRDLPLFFSAFVSAFFPAGLILAGQGAFLQVYLLHTMRRHDLPEGLLAVGASLLQLLGLPVTSVGASLSLAGASHSITVPATWELFFDPVTALLWIGGIIAIGWFLLEHERTGEQIRSDHPRPGSWDWLWRGFQKIALVWTVILFVGSFLRVALLLGMHLHRLAITPGEVPVAAGDIFLSPTVHLLLALALTAVGVPAGWIACNQFPSFKPSPPSVDEKHTGEVNPSPADQVSSATNGTTPTWRSWIPFFSQQVWLRNLPGLGIVATFLGTFLLAFVFHFDPPGSPGSCRVAVVERHSTWEPSDRPYDTEHFGHDPSYSYTLAYRYCQQFFHMSRLGPQEQITFDRLKDYDVLVIKIPTERWSREEIAAVVDFVRGGGGVLFIGDHTNVFNSSTYLNDLCRHFGFTFAPDLLFWIPDAYRQPWSPRKGAHPAVACVPPLHFAVGCSIDPGRSFGRAVIHSGGLWSLPCDFHVPNYHPVPQWRSDMRYGTFIQCWAVRYGRGRVLAFTDSTIFSNFCIFQPGKAELLRELIWWLCRRGVYDKPALRWIIPLGVGILAFAMLTMGALAAFVQKIQAATLAAILAGWGLGICVVDYFHRSFTRPSVITQPAKWVVIDRTTSQVPLALGAFSEDEEGGGYGLLEQWVSRLGYFTARRAGLSALGETGLLVVCPTKSPPPEFLEGLVDYVSKGGRLLVLDSPTSQGTTANSLLWPFGLEVLHATARGGKIRFADGGPLVEIDTACEVKGGHPLAWIDDLPVAARTKFGAGTVIAVGFATLWNDNNMGGHWMIAEEPTLFRRQDLEPKLRERFDLLFALLRHWLEDKPFARPPGPDTAKPLQGG